MTEPQDDGLERWRFAPDLVRLETGGAELQLRLHRPSDPEDAAGEVIWRRHHDKVAPARTALRYMQANPGQWSYWGRLALALGEQPLADLIREEISADAERRLKEKQLAEEARMVTLRSIKDKHRPGLCLVNGIRNSSYNAFWTMRFSTAIDRDRVWDWACRQNHSFLMWRDHFEAHGAAALERLILEGMMATERAVKKQGLSAGGQRPLRFWRGEA